VVGTGSGSCPVAGLALVVLKLQVLLLEIECSTYVIGLHIIPFPKYQNLSYLASFLLVTNMKRDLCNKLLPYQ
jgi:hypothetical protein